MNTPEHDTTTEQTPLDDHLEKKATEFHEWVRQFYKEMSEDTPTWRSK